MWDQAQAPPFSGFFGTIRSAGMTCKTLPCRFCGGSYVVISPSLKEQPFGGQAPCTDATAAPHGGRPLCALQAHVESSPARVAGCRTRWSGKVIDGCTNDSYGWVAVACARGGRANGLEVDPRGQGPRPEADAAHGVHACESRDAGRAPP